MSVRDDERAESDIRKRAAWLLAMLAVVAGLFVLLSLTLFKTSDHSSSDAVEPSVPTGVVTSPGPPRTHPSTPSTAASATPSTAGGTVPTPSCPNSRPCAVHGDVAATMAAINAYRAQHGKKPVPTTSSARADTCALTDGSECPSSFVWVRVDDLSGSGVVTGVNGFNSSDDLLNDSARSFEVGWAYNPTGKSLSCALIRDD